MGAAHEFLKIGDIVMLRTFLANGGKADDLNEEGETALFTAIHQTPIPIDFVKVLLEAGADPNFVQIKHDPGMPDHMIESMKSMLSETDFPEDSWAMFEPHDVKTYLIQEAVRYGNVEILKLFHSHGANLDYSCDSNSSAALDAYFNQTAGREILEYLVAQGISLDRVSNHGQSLVRESYFYDKDGLFRFVLEAGASEEILSWSPLHKAIVLGTPEDIQREAVQQHFSTQDVWGYCPTHLAVKLGQWDTFQLLCSLGADPDALTRDGKSQLEVAIQHGQFEITRTLLTETSDQESLNRALVDAISRDHVDIARFLLEAGANPNQQNEYGKPVIDDASDTELLRTLIEYGASIEQVSFETKRKILDLGEVQWDAKLAVTRDEYFANRFPRYGVTNPEDVTDAFKVEMIRTGLNAYHGRAQFDDPATFSCGLRGNRPPAVWCFDRFGQTITKLPDGRFILTAGEHEDSYDPDFCIYNDVTVFDTDGSIRLYSYPLDVFPPTDFHSATLVGDSILILGSLGYAGDRYGSIPVFKLNTSTLAIERVVTSGDVPPRMYGHRATLVSDTVIRIEGGTMLKQIKGEESFDQNPDTFELHLQSMKWIRKKTD